MRPTLLFLLSIILVTELSAHASCRDALSGTNAAGPPVAAEAETAPLETIKIEGCTKSCPPEVLAHKIVDALERRSEFPNPLKQNIRGHAILVSTMITTAAVSSVAVASLPPHFQFISAVIGPLAAIGIYTMGAPIWEPIQSAIRRLAFGVRENSKPGRPSDKDLEEMWFETQEKYSLNSQMSRNIINQFISSTRQNFYEAYRAMKSDNPEYAGDQIAEAAFRLRRLFKDISPDDPSVAAAIRSAFSDHISDQAALSEWIWKKLRAYESDWHDPATQAYYDTLLKNWLGSSVPSEP